MVNSHISKGRRQNSSVAFGDFLQRMTNVGWQGFAAQLHPYHMLLFSIHFNVFFVNCGQLLSNLCLLLHKKEWQSFVSSPANICHLLSSFVGYFDVFPKLNEKNRVRTPFLCNVIHQSRPKKGTYTHLYE